VVADRLSGPEIRKGMFATGPFARLRSCTTSQPPVTGGATRLARVTGGMRSLPATRTVEVIRT